MGGDERMVRRGDDDRQPAAEERHGRDRRPRPCRGAGRRRCRPAAARAARRTVSPSTASTAISMPSSRAANAFTSGPTCSADDRRRRDLDAARLARRVVDGAPGLLGEAEDLARQGGEAPPAGRERDPAARADEELVAELLAQRGDRDGHRRLGDPELGGGGLHRAQARDEDERLQLSERHRRATLSNRFTPFDASIQRKRRASARWKRQRRTPCRFLHRSSTSGRPASSTRSSCCSVSGPEARLLAGGHSLLPMMKLRLADAGAPHRHRRPGRRARLHPRGGRRGAHRRDDAPPRAARVRAARPSGCRSSPTPSA